MTRPGKHSTARIAAPPVDKEWRALLAESTACINHLDPNGMFDTSKDAYADASPTSTTQAKMTIVGSGTFYNVYRIGGKFIDMPHEHIVTDKYNPVLLTLTCEGEFADMAEDHRAIHQAYCDKHGFDLVYGTLPQLDGHNWDKMKVIRDLLASGVPFVAYIDADAIVADMDTDLRNALPEGKWLGLTSHPYPAYDREFHLQVGCMYWRSHPDAIRFLDNVLEYRDKFGEEQMAINALLLGLPGKSGDQSGFQLLGTEWNANIHNQNCAKPIVAAWHGYGDAKHRRAVMRDWMAARGKADAISPEEMYLRAHTAATQGRSKDAEHYYRALLSSDRDYHEAARSYAKLLAAQGRYWEAINLLVYAGIKEPKHTGNAILLANSYIAVGEYDAAAYTFEHLMHIGPDTPYFEWCYSLFLLGRGTCWAKAWHCYEDGYGFRVARSRSLSPKWDGSAIEGLKLYVCHEQGMGDVLFFARWLPMLKSISKAHVVLETTENMVPLALAWMKAGIIDEVQMLDPNFVFGSRWAYWTSLGSIPNVLCGQLHGVGFFETSDQIAHAIIAEAAQFMPPPSAKFRLGVCWKGSPAHPNDRARSMNPCDLQSIFDMPVDIVNLQYGDAPPCAHIAPDISTTDKMAAAVLSCDAVVSVDTFVANLAGTLNIPGAVLVPVCVDWRWMHKGDRSPWYPSLKVIRSVNAGEWSDAVSAAVGHIAGIKDKINGIDKGADQDSGTTTS